MNELMRIFADPSSRLPCAFVPSTFGKLMDSFLDNDDVSKFTDIGIPYNIREIRSKTGQAEAHVLELALAGYKKENITVDFNEGTRNIEISVKGEKRSENSGEVCLIQKLTNKDFFFSYHLSGVDIENISSTFVDGILRINLPKIQNKSSRKTISIE